MEEFCDYIIRFGIPAIEILTGARIPLREPKFNDADEKCRVKYPLAFHAATKDEVDQYGPELSDVGENYLLSNKQYCRTRKTQREDHAQQLVAYIRGKIAPGSMQALSV